MKFDPVLTRILEDDASRVASRYAKDIIWLRISAKLGFPKDTIISGLSDGELRTAIRSLIT